MKGFVIPAKIKILFYCLTGLLAIYSLLGFLVIPAVLSDQIPKIAKENFNRTAVVKEIKFNPFSMEFTLNGFELKNLDDSTFVSFEQFYTNVAVVQSIKDLTLTIDQVILNQPYGLIKRNKQGDFNFTDLKGNAEPEKEPETNDQIFPVTITLISIKQGKFKWEDDLYSKPQREEIYPLNLDINNFTTIAQKQSQLGFSLKLISGGTLDWQGNITLTPLKSSGKIKLDKVDFHKVWQLFLQDSVNFEILKGTELIEADYALTDTANGMQLLINNAHVNLYDFQLSEKGNAQPLIDVPDFKLSGISFDLLNKNVEIDKVSGKNAKFKAWLDTQGIINYQPLFSMDSTDTPVSNQEPNQTVANSDKEPWKVKVNQFELTNYSVNFTDNSLATPALLNLSSINLTATALTSKSGANLPFDLTLKFNQTGNIAIKGGAVLDPFSSRLKINLKDIALNDFQPYIDPFARLDIISGLFNLDASVVMQPKADNPLAISFTGDSQITNFISKNRVTGKEILNWKKLSLSEVSLDLDAQKYTIAKVKIDRLYSRVLIRKDKSLNINDIAIPEHKKQKPALEKKQNTEKGKIKPSFKIAKFEITRGVSDFSDRSLILPFSVHINNLKGSINGISSKKNATIKIDLNGRVANLAPVLIKGKITPDNGNSEFDLSFKSMPLPMMSPYMAEFAGRKIEKGNMSLDLQYKIQGKKLDASNNLLIDQLVLGEEVDNPEATSLPLGLAIALLEDADGKINLNVPITGDLDNPEFSVGSIIFDALINVLTKIVTSPFYAISSLIEGDEDVSKITFSAGVALLDDNQQKKLDGLVTALAKRPALKLEIKGAAFTDKDWPYLQAESLEKQLLQMRADELNKDTDKKVLVQSLTPNQEERNQVLADLFIQKFPDLGDRSFLGKPQLLNPEMGDFFVVAETKLKEIIPPDTQRLNELATARAQAIAKHLVEKNIDVERVFLLHVVTDPEDSDGTITTNLNLTVD